LSDFFFLISARRGHNTKSGLEYSKAKNVGRKKANKNAKYLIFIVIRGYLT